MPQIAVTVDQDLLDKIELIAKKVNQSRSSMVEFLLKEAVEARVPKISLDEAFEMSEQQRKDVIFNLIGEKVVKEKEVNAQIVNLLIPRLWGEIEKEMRDGAHAKVFAHEAEKK